MTGGERVLSWHDRSLIPNLAFIGLVLACVAIVQPDVQGIWIPLAALAGMPLLLNPTVELKGRQLVVNKWWEASRGRTRSTYAIDPRWNWLRRRNRGPWELAPDRIRLGGSWLYGQPRLVSSFRAAGFKVQDDRAEFARLRPGRGRVVWLLPRLAVTAALLTLGSWLILGQSILTWLIGGVAITSVMAHEILTSEGEIVAPPELGEAHDRSYVSTRPAVPGRSSPGRKRTSRH
jgi:hypothetical protein